MICHVLQWIGFLLGIAVGYCLWRRIQVRRYRRAKREAVAAAERQARIREAMDRMRGDKP